MVEEICQHLRDDSDTMLKLLSDLVSESEIMKAEAKGFNMVRFWRPMFTEETLNDYFFTI